VKLLDKCSTVSHPGIPAVVVDDASLCQRDGHSSGILSEIYGQHVIGKPWLILTIAHFALHREKDNSMVYGKMERRDMLSRSKKKCTSNCVQHSNPSPAINLTSTLALWACKLPEPEMPRHRQCDPLHDSEPLRRVRRYLRDCLGGEHCLGREQCRARGHGFHG
jgi:hypothetical protein